MPSDLLFNRAFHVQVVCSRLLLDVLSEWDTESTPQGLFQQLATGQLCSLHISRWEVWGGSMQPNISRKVTAFWIICWNQAKNILLSTLKKTKSLPQGKEDYYIFLTSYYLSWEISQMPLTETADGLIFRKSLLPYAWKLLLQHTLSTSIIFLSFKIL